MLRARLITAITLLGILLPLFLWAPVALIRTVMLLICVLASWEWARLSKASPKTALVFALLCGLVIALLWWMLEASTLLWVAAANLVFWLWVAHWGLKNGLPQFFRDLPGALALLGVLVMTATWEASYVAIGFGPWLLISLMSVVWVSDIAAYFTGKAFGKHKLAPHISPGKTWEGVAGALLFTLLVFFALAYFLPPDSFNFYSLVFHRVGGWLGALVLMVLVALGIVGDLFESMLKRQAGVKDSSSLLPGHGGVLDRIDALLPVLPAGMLFEYLTR